MNKKNSKSWRNRGYIDDEDFQKYDGLKFKELKMMLQDKESWKRSVAIRLISEKYFKESEADLSMLFLEILKNEKALYTRLEAQRGLEKGGIITIVNLCESINKIPNKQHVQLPEKITQKKTYPIARDVPVRILSNIGILALPYLKETIDIGEEDIVKEALDGFGYILYHNKGLNYDDYLISLFEKHIDNEIVIWKLIRAMSGTKSKKIKNYLLNYDSFNNIHKQEIARTITFIDK